jgi:hypothetical protein
MKSDECAHRERFTCLGDRVVVEVKFSVGQSDRLWPGHGHVDGSLCASCHVVDVARLSAHDVGLFVRGKQFPPLAIARNVDHDYVVRIDCAGGLETPADKRR